MRKLTIFILIAAFMTLSAQAFADTKGQVVFKDTVYGLLTGSILGAAVMTLTDEPEDHYEYIGYGAAAGAIAGAAFGFAEATDMVEFKDGKTYIAMPSIRMDRGSHNELRYGVGLIRVNF